MLDDKLRDRVLDRLGLTSPPDSDLDGLKVVYDAWCVSVPFDNVAKLISLRSPTPRPLPGLEADEFFNRLLDHGAAGTCWPTSMALFELLSALGFDARLVAGSMRDTGIISHGSIKARHDGADWLVDTSMLTRAPLPLTDEIHICGDKEFGAEIEPVDGTHMIWADLPPNPTLIPCRMLVDPATPGFYAERYEASRLRSPFNERLYAKRVRATGDRVILNANQRITKTGSKIEATNLTRPQLCESLRDEIGISAALIDEWRRSGALEASFKPATAPPGPAPTTLPPSMR